MKYEALLVLRDLSGDTETLTSDPVESDSLSVFISDLLQSEVLNDQGLVQVVSVVVRLVEAPSDS